MIRDVSYRAATGSRTPIKVAVVMSASLEIIRDSLVFGKVAYSCHCFVVVSEAL
jgi:hypothetical protein